MVLIKLDGFLWIIFTNQVIDGRWRKMEGALHAYFLPSVYCHASVFSEIFLNIINEAARNKSSLSLANKSRRRLWFEAWHTAKNTFRILFGGNNSGTPCTASEASSTVWTVLHPRVSEHSKNYIEEIYITDPDQNEIGRQNCLFGHRNSKDM